MHNSLDEFEFQPDLATDYGAILLGFLERLKINVSTFSQFLLIQSF